MLVEDHQLYFLLKSHKKKVPTTTIAKLSGWEDGSTEVELISKLSTAS